MQTRKTTHNWAIAAAVAAMLTASTVGVRAQDTSTPGTATPGTATPGTTTPPGTNATSGTGTSSAPAPLGGTSGSMDNSPNGTGTSGSSTSGSMSGNMSSGSMSGGMMSGSTGTDYSILSNPAYDYIDLQQAKARGLSDSQIATIAKIAKESGMPFSEVARAVERGQTFPVLAGEYNLKLADVYSADKEKQEIADYISTYESIGTKNGSSGMSGGMDTGSMSGGMSGGSSSSMGSTSGSTTGSSTSDSTGTTSGSTSGSSTSGSMATMDIVDTAMAAKNLTTLVKALQVAGLVETLKGAGPFTVFAPTDQAFSRLPAGQLDALLADPARLKTILTYHVIPASIMASDASAMTSPTSPPTVQGGTLQVTKGRRGRLRVNDANITRADIRASNGVIHIIDHVLMPPTDSAGATGTGTGATGTGTDSTGGTGAGTGTGTGTGAGAGTGTGTGTTPTPAPAQ